MKEILRHLTNQELVDRLAELTTRFSSGRGFDKAHEFCKMDIEEILEEIEERKVTGSKNASIKRLL
jgi:ribosomal protein L29